MHALIIFLIILIALFHFYAFILEVFLWETPKTMQSFGTTSETAKSSRTLAINQGVYNLFLVAGLIWSVFAPDPLAYQLKVFFLGCVLIAALTVGLVSSKKIMLMQGSPALLALILIIINR